MIMMTKPRGFGVAIDFWFCDLKMLSKLDLVWSLLVFVKVLVWSLRVYWSFAMMKLKNDLA